MKDVLSNFTEIEVEKPDEKIIRQIRELISTGQLKPGDRLPSERQLSERLCVGRTYVRDAIKKLEFYGILKTLPQSGTVVAGIGMTALEGLISDVLKLEDSDFYSLVETRVLLEAEAAKLAAMRRTEEDIHDLQAALDNYRNKAILGDPAVGEDFMFHLKIAELSKNGVIKSLMMIIAPEIMAIYKKLSVCEDGKLGSTYDEHVHLLEAIKEGKPEEASRIMTKHLGGILKFSKEHSNK